MKSEVVAFVDISLLRQQRDTLLEIQDDYYPKGLDTWQDLEGILNMMNAMLDRYDGVSWDGSYQKENIKEALKKRNAPSGASGTLHNRCEEVNKEKSFDTEFIKPHSETDPGGLDAHESGAKLDHGKLRPALVLGGFSKALTAVTEVGTYGATKYTPNGWKDVAGGETRYKDAAMRHWLKYLSGERENEEDGGVSHLAQIIWNLCAVYELTEGEDK